MHSLHAVHTSFDQLEAIVGSMNFSQCVCNCRRDFCVAEFLYADVNMWVAVAFTPLHCMQFINVA